MNATTHAASSPPLGPHWLLLALGPPTALLGWLWLSGAFERAGCAVSGSLLALLVGG
jgi:hypothetical protein